MGTAAEIYNILNYTANNQLNYCLFCLRTELERRLVKPATFLKCFMFYKPARYCWPLSLGGNSVCYICEAELQRALRLLHAMDFALAVQRCLNDLQDINCNIQQFQSTLNKNVEMRDGLTLDGVWREVRCMGTLACTEILKVTTESDGNLQTNQKLQEDIVVVIEDDEAAVPLPRLVALEQLLCSQEPRSGAVLRPDLLLTRAQGRLHQIQKHKIQARNGNFYIPSLKAKLLNNSLVYSDCDGLVAEEPSLYEPEEKEIEALESHKINRIVNPPKKKRNPIKRIQDITPINTIPVREVKNTYKPKKRTQNESATNNQQKSRSVDQNSVMNHETNKVNGDTTNIELTIRVPNIGEIYSPEKMSKADTVLIMNPATSGDSVKPRFSFEDNDDSLYRDIDAELSKSFAPAKAAVMSGRVDWEDKIPMDVISFMDATDPNAEQLLNTNDPTSQSTRQTVPDFCMPTIQNVESVSHKQTLSRGRGARKPCKKRRIEEDCVVIDLC